MMIFSLKRKIILISLVVLLTTVTVLLGLAQGIIFAANKNLQRLDNFGEEKLALSTRVLDINENLITEFFSDEKREIITIHDVPENMIFSLVTREDKTFFLHNGISIRGIIRAFVNIALGRYYSGGSTLTQQVATQLYEDKADQSMERKIREFWWAYQLEREYTKYEILENYINKMPFGHGTNGIEAASKFYFNHSASENTIAESVLIVIQLAKPGLYSPIRNPDIAKKMQRRILDQVVSEGYVGEVEADLAFNQYWNSYDWNRITSATPFWERKDKAPFFSEYIRSELDEMILGTQDIYRDGYTVYTTLNLDYQKTADEVMAEALNEWNKTYNDTLKFQLEDVNKNYIKVIDMLSLVYNLPDLRVQEAKFRKDAKKQFRNNITPLMDLLSLSFNLENMNYLSRLSYSNTRKQRQQTKVETALITLENSSGYILSMIGGSEFSRTNQFNRAVQGNIQPGSAFKPLYYSAAISSRKFTPATHIYDTWTVFNNPDGTPYTPQNYRGEWKGDVLLRDALANSMNVPSVKVLNGIGFDAAINRAAKLFGLEDPAEIGRIFPRVYPLGLGIITVSPIQLARAYATFGNEGKAVTPLAIRFIEDRNGNIIMNPEEDLRKEQRKKDLQVLSPQENYIMVSLLENVVKQGTLSYWYATNRGRKLPMTMGGKTGTTQNWSDAWTCGFSPYYTTVIWAGFDQPGSSLGQNQSGARSVGPFWTKYMASIHKDLEPREFPKPETGLVELTICKRSGKRPTSFCSEDSHYGVRKEVFLEGTEPHEECDIHLFEDENRDTLLHKIYSEKSNNTYNNSSNSDDMNLDLLNDLDIDLDHLYETKPRIKPKNNEKHTNDEENPTEDDNSQVNAAGASPDASETTPEDNENKQTEDDEKDVIDMTIVD